MFSSATLNQFDSYSKILNIQKSPMNLVKTSFFDRESKVKSLVNMTMSSANRIIHTKMQLHRGRYQIKFNDGKRMYIFLEVSGFIFGQYCD